MTIAEKPWNMPVVDEEILDTNSGDDVEYATKSLDLGGENPTICYFIDSDTMGQGDKDLGVDLLTKFFSAMNDKCMHPDYVILVNRGVYLAQGDKETSACLNSLVKRGTKILVSQESVNYYELNGQISVGELTSLSEILIIINGIDKVVTL